MMRVTTARKIAYGMVPAIVLLTVVEAASYAYYQYAVLDDFMAIDISDSFHNIPDLFERRNMGEGEVLFSRYFPERYYVSDRNYRGKTMAVEKTTDVYRVFTFGGSSTAGSPWGHEASFSRFLEDELNSFRRSATRVEVVNFGGGGYGSTRALGLVEASIQYKPDVIVFYEGHNEMSDNWIYQDVAKGTANSGIRRYTSRLYLFRVARALLQRGPAKPPERVDLLKSNAMFIPKPIQDKKGFKASDRRYLTAQFKKNLEGLIQASRSHGATVLLVSQPSNLFYEPSWYPAATDAAENELVAELRTAYASQDLASAARHGDDILRLNPENPVAHFYLGLMAVQEGNPAAARNHLLAAVDLDESPERFTRAYRAIEEALGDERSGVFFIDAWTAAMDSLDDRLTDGRLIIDKMHPTVEGNKLIARKIVTDYFLRHRIRQDLFDYERDDPDRIWNDNIDPAFYHVICARYFDITDPERCVDEVSRRYDGAVDNLPERRIYRSSWEYLFYYGLSTRDPSWLQKSAAIYGAMSLAHALRPQPPVQAAHQ
jgi:lysophospholipase L1-like esterase